MENSSKITLLKGEIILERDYLKDDVILKHNYLPQFLKWPKEAFNPPTQANADKTEYIVNVIATNQRLIFELSDGSQINADKAPDYVKDFFEVCYGQVLRVEYNQGNTEKVANNMVDDNGDENFQQQAKRQRTGTSMFNYFTEDAGPMAEIWIRDGRKFNVEFSEGKQAEEFVQHVKDNAFFDIDDYESLKNCAAFKHQLETTWKPDAGIESQTKRMHLAIEGKYKVLDNEDYEQCRTYPSKMIVPSAMSEEDLKLCASFRSKKRIPSLTYYHKSSKCSIWRCSQPLSGMFNRIEEGDVKMLNEISKLAQDGVKPGITIFDARPKTSASGNRVRGGGFEDERYYENCNVHFCGIRNIHAVRNSHEALRLMSATPDVFKNIHVYGPDVEASNWMQVISDILRGVNEVVHTITVKQKNALVRCSDGWDRTSQLCALSQILLDPHFRTISGFMELVEKDWLSFGHKFHERLGIYNSKYNDEEKSPIFIQFLDCIRQIMMQNPKAFEWNEDFLLFVANGMLSGKYGTFLGDCEKERKDLKLAEQTASIWTEIDNQRERFTNTQYKEHNDAITKIKETEYSKLIEWRSFFFKWSSFGYNPIAVKKSHGAGLGAALNVAFGAKMKSNEDFIRAKLQSKLLSDLKIASLKPFGYGLQPKQSPQYYRSLVTAEFIAFSMY